MKWIPNHSFNGSSVVLPVVSKCRNLILRLFRLNVMSVKIENKEILV